ncbi:MAG: aminotransferase class V-fold PLP-dependent enzyme [Proteobacteria bacterium]|nr:aminotransferase class V-fold PLP-dependent enzyme [Pseudomonadota bacterium]
MNKRATTARAGTPREPRPAPDWEGLRREFPTTGRLAYLDLARKAILPRRVEGAIGEWMTDVYERGGEDAFAMDPIEETRRTVARLVGAPANTIALVKNTSEGINIVANGLDLKPGDNVVIGECEHENNTFPWRHHEARGVEVRVVRAEPDGSIAPSAYAGRIDSRTRVLSCAWVTYGTGFRSDLEALSALCRERGVRLIVDGVQAVGILDRPIGELGVDALACGGHKALFSLAGAGFLYVSEGLIGELRPPYAAKFSFSSNDRRQKPLALAADAHRFEYGNPNFLGCWVQRRSAEFLMEVGLANIERRVRALTTYLIERADALGLKVATPRPWDQRAGIVSFDVPGDPTATVRRLKSEGVVVSVKDGRIRASCHFFNNEADLDRLLAGLRRSNA